jgi:flagellar hook protein FlgE
MQQYFIKQPYDSANPNYWQMLVQVDGRDVGAPTDATDPINTATPAVYDVYFTSSGALDEVATGDIDVINWIPVDSSGTPNGSVGPNDFQLDLTGSTQVANDFEVRSVNQDGTTNGRLAGINIDDSGIIFARYTNGQNRIIAQVAMADFANTQGLEAVGDTSWAETSESGEPVIGSPGTASLGLIQSGALEGSNVDLSEQLVNLIIAQRNFQANAKTIETANQTTQTIINLR